MDCSWLRGILQRGSRALSMLPHFGFMHTRAVALITRQKSSFWFSSAESSIRVSSKNMMSSELVQCLAIAGATGTFGACVHCAGWDLHFCSSAGPVSILALEDSLMPTKVWLIYHNLDEVWIAGVSFCSNLKTLRLQGCRRIDSNPGPVEHLGYFPALGHQTHHAFVVLRRRRAPQSAPSTTLALCIFLTDLKEPPLRTLLLEPAPLLPCATPTLSRTACSNLISNSCQLLFLLKALFFFILGIKFASCSPFNLQTPCSCDFFYIFSTEEY